jgi:hypothetical protein
MRFISTRIYGILSYLTGAFLVLAPFLFGFAHGGPAQNVTLLTGIVIIAMSLLTSFEYGVIKIIPMYIRLGLDALIGIFLIMSPWWFDFAYVILWPQLLFGILGIGAALFTRADSLKADYPQSHETI